MFDTPGLGVHGYRHTEYPEVIAPPPSYDVEGFGIPPPSVGTKMIEPGVNASMSGHLQINPWAMKWEQNICRGMPLFVNSSNSRSKNYDNSVMGATPAILNFLWEESARTLYAAKWTTNSEQKEQLLIKYNDEIFKHGKNKVECVNEYWRYFGNVSSTIGKDAQSGIGSSFEGAGGKNIIVLCNVAGTADISNYWGELHTGDSLGWVIAVKKNIYKSFYDPKGIIRESSTTSPPEFLKIFPVVKKIAGSRAGHNTNFVDPSNPNQGDIDFTYKDAVIEQRELRIDMFSDSMKPCNLSMDKEALKMKDITTDLYSFGQYIPVGTVCEPPRNMNMPSKEHLSLALRNDTIASKLPMVKVHLSK